MTHNSELNEVSLSQEDSASGMEYLTKKSLRKFLGGVGATTIDNWIRSKNFPKPRRLSQTMPIWKKSEVIAWVESFSVQNI